MPPTSLSATKKLPLTLAQLASYDDFLTDALVDHLKPLSSSVQKAFYWTVVPKNRATYHASRGLLEAEITKIIQTNVILNRDVAVAEQQLLSTSGIARFYGALGTAREREDFGRHMRSYLRIYLPDCPFEVASTNRYTIITQEASIAARQLIKKNETIRYLCGIQVTITPDEEKEIAYKKKDFSIIVSSRSRCASLFMGPARFANHDCGANAKLVTSGQSGIEVIATTDIDAGDEITVSYGLNYFGEGNCECLCATCESRCVNGWAAPSEPDAVPSTDKPSIEDDSGPRSYSLRRRRRGLSAPEPYRTSPVTPDIRPKIKPRRQPDAGRAVRPPALNLAVPPSSPLPKASLARDSLNVAPVLALGRTRGRTWRFWGSNSGNLHQDRDSGSGFSTSPTTPARRRGRPRKHPTPPPSASVVSSSSSDRSHGGSASTISVDNDEAFQTDVTTPPGTSTSDLTTTVVVKCEDVENDRHVARNSTLLRKIPSRQYGSARLQGKGRPVIDYRRSTPAAGSTSGLVILSPVSSPQNATPCSEAMDADADAAAAAAAAKLIPQKRRRTGSVKQATPPPAAVRLRTPGDYTLTPLLLSQSEMAWIHCTNCSEAFVQSDAYCTRSSCPRCERHSKLYGFVWPKTEPAGAWDREPRVLDHRTVHRFLASHDEARARKRSANVIIPSSSPPPPPALLPPSDHSPPRKKLCSTTDGPPGEDGARSPEEADQDVSPPPLRRSGRVRQASSRMRS